MIGTQPTGRLPGVVISAVGHEGLSVTANGKPARLAVVDENGHVLVAGPEVAQEAEAVAINMYRAIWRHQGHLRVHSKPLGA